MQNESITLSRAVLAGLAQLAATKDVRHYLNGVAVLIEKDGVFLAATDGHVAGVYRVCDNDDREPGQFVIKSDDLGRLPKLKAADKRKKRSDELSLTIDADGKRADLLDVTGGITVHCGDGLAGGKYPDVFAILPADCPDPKPGHFNPAYLERCAKAAATMAGQPMRPDSVLFIQRGPNTAATFVHTALPDFVGVVMPIAVRETVADMVPTWARKPASL